MPRAVNTFDHRIRFMTKEESWDLLRENVFGKDGLCPPQLEKAGKKIAENCEGLPLTVVTVADLLSKVEKTPEYWNMAAEKQSPVFKDAYDQMWKVLYSSYEFLPQHLEPCFLGMGVFPQNYDIPISKLIKLWSVEGFLELSPSENFVMGCLREFRSTSVIMLPQQGPRDKIKTCNIRSVFWYLCTKEAGRNKFFHILNSYEDGLAEDIKIQRRLCIYNNILFGIKQVYDSMASISTARSLLCFGPYHQYSVPICIISLKLLGVIDALSIHLYEFPTEVVKLPRLRYLALNCNGNIPVSISKLWYLEYLIVRHHVSIKSSGSLPYLPVQIWDMKELKHLQIMGSNLLDPPCGAVLPNLLALLDVCGHSCTRGVLEAITNLEKLRIQIEQKPVATAKSFQCFDNISHLKKLVSLKCAILNPIMSSEVVISPPPPLPSFSSSLKKLTLSGFGYPWNYTREIESLPNLEVLKLQSYAFRGPKWETREDGFRKLRIFSLENSDLVHWTASPWSFHKASAPKP